MINIEKFEKHLGITFNAYNNKILYNIINFIRNKRKKESFIEIQTPCIVHKYLFEKTGHLSHYKDDMFFINENHALKPMSCPGAAEFVKFNRIEFKNQNIVKIFEIGSVFRKEKTGALLPFIRMPAFRQDDIHIFCKKISDCFDSIFKLVQDWKVFYGEILEYEYQINLSTKPNNSLGIEEDWKTAENLLIEVLKENNLPILIEQGEGAFYGPKLDLSIKHKNKYTQLATVQLDFFLCKNLNVNNFNFVVHSALFGSIERFFGIIKEKKIPDWLLDKKIIIYKFCSEQYFIKIFNLLPKFYKYEIIDKIKDFNVFLKLNKNNIIIILGNKEEKLELISIRNNNKIENYNINKFNFFEKDLLINNFFEL